MKTRRHLVWITTLLAVVACVTVCFSALTRADNVDIADRDSVGLPTERRLLVSSLLPESPVVVQTPMVPKIMVNTKVTVTFDNHNATGGEYYGKSRTAMIQITDRDFNPNDFYIGVEYSPYYFQDYGPIERKNVTFSPVSGQADTYKGTLTFSTNGRYILKIE